MEEEERVGAEAGGGWRGGGGWRRLEEKEEVVEEEEELPWSHLVVGMFLHGPVGLETDHLLLHLYHRVGKVSVLQLLNLECMCDPLSLKAGSFFVCLTVGGPRQLSGLSQDTQTSHTHTQLG